MARCLANDHAFGVERNGLQVAGEGGGDYPGLRLPLGRTVKRGYAWGAPFNSEAQVLFALIEYLFYRGSAFFT